MDLSLVSRRHLNEAFLGNSCNGELLESALLFRACFLIDGQIRVAQSTLSGMTGISGAGSGALWREVN